MSRPTPGFPRTVAALALCALATSGCKVVDARVWNLKQVHHPSGGAKYRGSIQNPTSFALLRALQKLHFSSQTWDPSKEKEIEDPFEVCLDNLNALAECDRDNPRTRSLMIENFAWLGASCTYSLSRERCGLELGELGRSAGVEGPRWLEEGVEPAGAAEVGEALTGILQAARPIVEERAGGGVGAMLTRLLPGDRSAQERADETSDIGKACAAARTLVLDLDGARRLLAASTLLLDRTGFDEPQLAPLYDLHEAMARLCIELALGALVRDPNAHARAAGITACVAATDNHCPVVVEAGLRDPAPEVRRAAVEVFCDYGIPPAPPDATSDQRAANEELWLDRLVEIASIAALAEDGPSTVAACKALSSLTGRPETLRHEEWRIWWADHLESTAPPGAAGGG